MQQQKDLSEGERARLLPVAGILLFVCCYIIAAVLYPGGSQADKNAQGFSWLHNYWCNLLNDRGINGQPNAGKWWGRMGMTILGASLCAFWWIFFRYAGFSKRVRFIITGCGVAAMILTLFLFTTRHDLLVTLSSLLGFIAMVTTFAGLYRLKWKQLFWLGIINVFLVAVNNVFYYTPSLIYLLPLVQKITFLLFLVWVCAICFRIPSVTIKFNRD
ncbi:hypothetical protein [Niabella sp.]|uniref:hypothetical protein n=1 Tax=Niabella sp. TaxID=1962976 RepID=UPI00262C8669|nr:hypothetical protein [Niabella sp.]